MSYSFYFSNPIFRLCYDKYIRSDLYNKIINSNSKELLSSDSNQYLYIKWISETDLSNLVLEEASDDDILALNYLKKSIKYFKILSTFTIINITSISSFLINYKNVSQKRRKLFSYYILMIVFLETPYLILGLDTSDEEILNKKFEYKLEKFKMFYKI